MNPKDLIDEEYRDSDGYWIYLKYGFKCDGEHTIVEDTKKGAYAKLKNAVPCNCVECRFQK